MFVCQHCEFTTVSDDEAVEHEVDTSYQHYMLWSPKA